MTMQVGQAGQADRRTLIVGVRRGIHLDRDDPAAFDLVLSDVTMPGMTGDKMGQRMLARRPELPVLLMTGYTKILTGEQAAALGFRGLLAKPVPQNDLLAILRRVLTTPAEAGP